MVDLKDLLFRSQTICEAVKSNYMQNNQVDLSFLEHNYVSWNSIDWKNSPESHSELLFEAPCIFSSDNIEVQGQDLMTKAFCIAVSDIF